MEFKGFKRTCTSIYVLSVRVLRTDISACIFTPQFNFSFQFYTTILVTTFNSQNLLHGLPPPHLLYQT